MQLLSMSKCAIGLVISMFTWNLVVAADIPPWMPSNNLERNSKVRDGSEVVDAYTGSLRLAYSDVYIPGNGGLPIEVSRVYDSQSILYGDSQSQTGIGGAIASNPRWTGLGLGWSIRVAPVLMIYPAEWRGNKEYTREDNKICGGEFDRPMMVLEHVDGSTEPVVVTKLGVARTASNWRVTCTDETSNFVLSSPDGTVYKLDQRNTDLNVGNIYDEFTARPAASFQATSVTDRNGNFLTINYAVLGRGLRTVGNADLWDVTLPVQITANDGRKVVLTYDQGIAYGQPGATRPRLTKITSETTVARTYSYSTNLTEVKLPTGERWGYSYYANDGSAGSGRVRSVTLPSTGARHYTYRNLSSSLCYNHIGGDPESIRRYWTHLSQVSSIESTYGDWRTYRYVRATDGGQYDSTTIESPSGREVRKFFGVGYFAPSEMSGRALDQQIRCTVRHPDSWKLGLPFSTDRGGQHLEEYQWTPILLSAMWSQGVWSRTPLGRSDSNYYVPVKTIIKTTRDGAAYQVTYSSFNEYFLPTLKSEMGPSGNRTISYVYQNDTTKWIIGRIKTESSAGHLVSRAFDSNGNLLSILKDGVRESFTYMLSGDVATRTTANGGITSYSAYKRGIAQNETHPEQVTISRVVDNAGNVISETDGEGRARAFTYDGLDRITSIDYPRGNTEKITFTAQSKTSNRGALVEATTYDGGGRPIRLSRGGIITTYRYDGVGNKVFESNPGSSLGRSYAYDSLGRLSRVTNPDGTTFITSYGPSTKTTIDERGQKTVYSYRSYGNPDEQYLMSIVAPNPAANVTITRNARDLITSVKQGGLTRQYGYNANYFLTSMINPETGTTTFGRDAAGNMTSSKVGASGTTSYGYDKRNRQTSITYPSGTPNVTKTYTKTDQIKSVTSSVAARAYIYDNNDNLQSDTLVVDGITLKTVYDYDPNDKLSSIAYPRSGRIVSYFPDALGRPTQASGYVTAVSYWPSGQFKQITYANGTVSNYGQNSRLWPSTFETKKGTTVYLNSSYAYDGLGNLTTIDDALDNAYDRTMGYDGISRLTSVKGPWGVGTIAYSGGGNITSQVLGTASLNYTYDANNRLTSIAGSRAATYTYDAYGNMASGAGNTYAYDSAPNLRCVNCASATNKIEYGYDGSNRRVWTNKGGVKSYEVHDRDEQQLIEYIPSEANKLTEYIYLGGKRVAQRVTP